MTATPAVCTSKIGGIGKSLKVLEIIVFFSLIFLKSPFCSTALALDTLGTTCTVKWQDKRVGETWEENHKCFLYGELASVGPFHGEPLFLALSFDIGRCSFVSQLIARIIYPNLHSLYTIMNTVDAIQSNKMLLDVSFEFDLQGLDESERKASHEFAIRAFCFRDKEEKRARNNNSRSDDLLCGTQHTVSTLGSTNYGVADDRTEEPETWDADDSDFSLASFADLNLDHESLLLSSCDTEYSEFDNSNDKLEAPCNRNHVVDKVTSQASRIGSEDDVDCVTDPYNNSGSVQEQQSKNHQFFLHDEEDEQQKGMIQGWQAQYRGQSSISTLGTDLGDSFSSYTDGFEKLHECISRTAETRRLVRQHMLRTNKKLVASSSSRTTREVSTGGGVNLRIAYQDCHSSASSVGSRSSYGSSSRGSLSTKKGRRTVHKKQTRRAIKSTTISRTGVAFRPCMAGLLDV